MGRAPCCDKMGVKRGPWTIQEDQILVSYIKNHGHSNWRALPKQTGLLRCRKSCRLRWTNYLRPDIKRGNFSLKEEETILKMHQLIGNRWSVIASYLPGRTDNEIKNVWNTSLKKRLVHMEANSLTDALPLPAKSSSFDSSTVEMADHGWNPLQNSITEDKIECQPFSGERIFIFKNQTYLEEPVQLPISHDKTETVTSSQGRPDCNGEILIRDHRVNSVNLLVGSPMQNFYGQEVDWLLHHPVDMSSMDSTVGTNYHQIWRKDFQVGEGMDYWVNILRQVEPLPVSHIAPACEALSSISTAVQL